MLADYPLQGMFTEREHLPDGWHCGHFMASLHAGSLCVPNGRPSAGAHVRALCHSRQVATTGSSSTLSTPKSEGPAPRSKLFLRVNMHSAYEHVREKAAKAVAFLSSVARPHRGMGHTCSKRAAFHKPLDQLELSRWKFACRRKWDHGPRVATLSALCLQRLASDPTTLTARVVDSLSNDLAQSLLEALIDEGTLTFELLPLFSAVALWRLPFEAYPGVHASWLTAINVTLVTIVDLSFTQVRCRSSHSLPRRCSVARRAALGLM